MQHRLQNRIHHNESSIYRLRSTSTSEWFQLSRPAINKKASQTRCLTFAPYAWRRFTPWGVMRCGRGLRTTHYIVRPRLTIYAAKICSFSLFAKFTQNSCQSILLLVPPVLVVVEDLTFAFRTTAFLVERNLVAEAELDELCNMEMALHGSLEIQIIP